MRKFILEKILPAGDRFGFISGQFAMGMIVILIFLMLYEVVSRKFFGMPTLWASDLSFMSNGTLFLLGAAYTLQRGGHIRIDFLSTQFPLRLQHLVNLLFYLTIFLPALGLTSYYSTIKAHKAFVRGEIETMSAWEPLIWPFLTGIAIGVIGLTIQILLESIRHILGIIDPDWVPGPGATKEV